MTAFGALATTAVAAIPQGPPSPPGWMPAFEPDPPQPASIKLAALLAVTTPFLAASAGAGNTTVWRQQPLNPEIFAPPFPVREQLYLAHTDRPFPQLPDGWRGQPLDLPQSIFQRPFKAATQQYYMFQELGTPPFAPVPFQFYPQAPVVFFKQTPITEHPYTSAPEPESFPPGLGWWGYKLDHAFAKGFPVEQQLYVAEQLIFVVPFVPPPGAGKRYKPPTDYLPEPAWDEKPNKPPVRPVWDRKPKVESPPPPAPTPLPPLSAFAERGPPRIMRKLNLPSFNEHIPANVAQFNQRMPEVLEESDAIAALRALGLIKDS